LSLPKFASRSLPSSHANLSGMLPHAPALVNSLLDAASTAEISQSGAHALAEAPSSVDHHCQLCPTCSHRLTGHRCKLVCAHCGYYMSCADYY
jgi:hypothetical protein